MQRDVKLYAEALAAANHKANVALTALEADQAGAQTVARARALRLQAARIDEQVTHTLLWRRLLWLPQHYCMGVGLHVLGHMATFWTSCHE